MLWVVPKPFVLVSSLLYASDLFLYFLFGLGVQRTCGCPFEWWRGALLTILLAVLFLIDRVEYWLYSEDVPPRTAFALLASRIVLVLVVGQLDTFKFYSFVYIIMPFLAVLYFGIRAGYAVAALFIAVEAFSFFSHNPDWYGNVQPLASFLIFVIGTIFATAMANIVVKEKANRAHAEQLLKELETSHRQLQQYSEQVAELATSKERNRLARDIHDSLGHYLTVINVQLEKAMAFRHKKPDEADRAVSDAKRLASEALQDVRHSVGALRGSPEKFTFHTALNELVQNMQHHSFTLHFTLNGSEEGFSNQALIALYRAAQEGLTNIQKHAEASRVRLTLSFDSTQAQLVLSDNGRGFEAGTLQNLPAEREGGYGLPGVQERLALVGGWLELESRPGEGTSLLITVPKASPVQNVLTPSSAILS